MLEPITIELNLHPLAWRVIQRECCANKIAEDKVIYDVKGTWIYEAIKLGLRKKRDSGKSTVPDKYKSGNVYVCQRDFFRRGSYLAIDNQILISQALVKIEKDKLCREIASAHIYSGVPVGTAIRYLILKYMYENDEISWHTLKKHYQRHGKPYEQELQIDFEELVLKKKPKQTH